MSHSYKKAFTLIELLVVISIIALLSTVVLGSIGKAREKATVSQIKDQVSQVQNALELYKTDNGTYPPNGLTYTTLMNTYLATYIQYNPLSFDGITSFDIETGWDAPVIPFYLSTVGNNAYTKIGCGDISNIPYALIFFSKASGIYPQPEYLKNHYLPAQYFLRVSTERTTHNEPYAEAHWGFCLSKPL